jgi:hypothetical protein
MPYPREQAGKGGHSDFIRNPDVKRFLESCSYLREPSDSEAEAIAALYQLAPNREPRMLPRSVVASDASKSDSPINDKLPSTQVGFLKVSHVMIKMEEYNGLREPQANIVNPFKVAAIHRGAASITFTMPGCNIKYKGNDNVKDSFRESLYDQLSLNRNANGGGLTLLQVLVEIFGNTIKIKACPACKADCLFSFGPNQTLIQCSACQKMVYATDVLRLHEGISDFGDNASMMTRMMNAIEHLLLASFILSVFKHTPNVLSEVAFVMDGPLAIFGEPAKLHGKMQGLIFKVNQYLLSKGLPQMLVIGLQKTGGLMDHAKLLERFLPNGSLRLVDDEYRNKYIVGAESPADNFGHETYYGQDFIFRTERGRVFNFSIPYPFLDKTLTGTGPGPGSAKEDQARFANAKAEQARYGDLLQQACDLIRHFEMDLYESAIVPVALAHRHASISIMPGGKVLDILARTTLRP